jgi:D-lactate dehydrogenase
VLPLPMLLHVYLQGFRTKEEVQRFSDLMEEMCTIVATKHSGECV